MHFADRLVGAVQRKRSAVLVGIDLQVESLPQALRVRHGDARGDVARMLATFAREVIDVVAPDVPAVKFPAGFYAACGREGMAALFESARHARERGLIAGRPALRRATTLSVRGGRARCRS